MALVAKTPRIAVTVTVKGAPMSWLRTGARLVLEKRVQSDWLVRRVSLISVVVLEGEKYHTEYSNSL